MYNEELKWIENGLDRLHETGKMGSLHWRATYTEEDQKARKLLEQWMREKDLEVFYDDVGNLFGKIEGEQDKIVLTGSHRDTVKNGGKYDGGDEKHQRREHDAAEGYGQIVRFLGKAGVDDMNQRPGEQHHKQADQQRERGEQVQRVAREAMRALGPELVFAANVERNQRAGDARGKQKHRQVKQAIGGIVRVRNAVAAEIIGHDHFTNETDGLRHKDDQRHRQRRSHQMIALRSHFRTSISDCAVPGRDSFSVYRKEGGFNTGKPACLRHTEIIP